MGYDLHITKRELWFEEGDDITPEEWVAVVDKDEELFFDKINGPYFATWNPSIGDGDYWLDWNEGCIYTKSPDSVMMAKMLDIARELGATLQGDEGEIYDNSYLKKQSQKNQMNQENHESQEKIKKLSWFERIFKKK